jgi:hypothetical protein
MTSGQHLEPELRRKSGRARRESLPRSEHARWEPPSGRRDPIVVPEEQEAGRVAELLPIRHRRMMGSPLAFFRGAAHTKDSHTACRPPRPKRSTLTCSPSCSPDRRDSSLTEPTRQKKYALSRQIVVEMATSPYPGWDSNPQAVSSGGS